MTKELKTTLKKLPSEMSGKLFGLQSINTNPQDSLFCQKSCIFGYRSLLKKYNKTKVSELTDQELKKVPCYSLRMLEGPRKNCSPKWSKNHDILTKRLLTTEEISLIKFKVDTIRLNAHGELDNFIHLLNYIAIINHNPHLQFTLWTKRIYLIDKFMKLGYEKPKNLILIYSSNQLNKRYDYNKLPKYFDKVFTVYDVKIDKDKKRSYDFNISKEIKINCGGNKCINCMLCYKVNKVKFINEFIK